VTRTEVHNYFILHRLSISLKRRIFCITKYYEEHSRWINLVRRMSKHLFSLFIFNEAVLNRFCASDLLLNTSSILLSVNLEYFSFRWFFLRQRIIQTSLKQAIQPFDSSESIHYTRISSHYISFGKRNLLSRDSLGL